jgi:hypothetical protein
VVSFTTRGKGALYPLDRRLGGAPEPVWTLWNGESLAPARNRTPAVQPVAVTIPTELSRHTYLYVDRRIILNWIFEKEDGRVRARFSWLKIGTRCGLLSTSGSMKDGRV